MEWVEESDQRLVPLLLDFEKMFDYINWDFFFFILWTLGFCERWIQWVLILYKVAMSSIRLNKEVGDLFTYFGRCGRGVRFHCTCLY
jgi:hypothetical protein